MDWEGLSEYSQLGPHTLTLRAQHVQSIEQFVCYSGRYPNCARGAVSVHTRLWAQSRTRGVSHVSRTEAVLKAAECWYEREIECKTRSRARHTAGRQVRVGTI